VSERHHPRRRRQLLLRELRQWRRREDHSRRRGESARHAAGQQQRPPGLRPRVALGGGAERASDRPTQAPSVQDSGPAGERPPAAERKGRFWRCMLFQRAASRGSG
jgi:hypothetical protein